MSTTCCPTEKCLITHSSTGGVNDKNGIFFWDGIKMTWPKTTTSLSDDTVATLSSDDTVARNVMHVWSLAHVEG